MAEKLQEIKHIYQTLKELEKIAKQLHRLYEAHCNYGLTARQEKREEKLREKARKLAEQLGLKVYIQGDPRGLPLYLIEKEGRNYWDGLPISL